VKIARSQVYINVRLSPTTVLQIRDPYLEIGAAGLENIASNHTHLQQATENRP
jgi:hypothetical protein